MANQLNITMNGNPLDEGIRHLLSVGGVSAMIQQMLLMQQQPNMPVPAEVNLTSDQPPNALDLEHLRATVNGVRAVRFVMSSNTLPQERKQQLLDVSMTASMDYLANVANAPNNQVQFSSTLE